MAEGQWRTLTTSCEKEVIEEHFSTHGTKEEDCNSYNICIKR